eukprot:TRINITY_DN82629_c0_g1_i1.p1 TRINITY_DN82629_c0_g1~~TRINITY_DN82629_c0_g1_i1.p1  ORF type:complete len:394 (+),score=85.69 TRINITY_DN82629_c0_g1_i1:57-1238(+)
MLVILTALCTVAAGLNLRNPEHQFAAFIQKFGRPYQQGSVEYEQRLALFKAHVSKVERINAQPGMLWKAGISPLADYTQQELNGLMGWSGYASSTGGRGGSLALLQGSSTSDLPKEVNSWDKLDSLFARDQGECGSCWAISAATVLANHAEIYNSSRKDGFSTQELLSCVANPNKCGGDGGCKGATLELAMKYAMEFGLTTPAQHLYTAKDSPCPTNGRLELSATRAKAEDMTVSKVYKAASNHLGPQFGMFGWEKLPENKYEPLLRAVYERGPVGVSVAASEWSFYDEGIFDGCQKDAVINHAVTLIGYGEADVNGQKQKYWRIQNSWGEFWGEDGGRIRLLRKDDDDKNYCGIDKQPQDGSGCEGGPKEVTVCGMCGVLYDTVVPYFGKAN